MADELYGITENELLHLIQNRECIARSEGILLAAEHIRKLAGDMFANGQDEEAVKIRALAKRIENLHDKKEPACDTARQEIKSVTEKVFSRVVEYPLKSPEKTLS